MCSRFFETPNDDAKGVTAALTHEGSVLLAHAVVQRRRPPRHVSDPPHPDPWMQSAVIADIRVRDVSRAPRMVVRIKVGVVIVDAV